jgi:hypothetical protein
LRVLRTRGGKRERGSLVVAVMVAVEEVWRCLSGAEEEYKDSCRNMN